jgi:hypothetical protein
MVVIVDLSLDEKAYKSSVGKLKDEIICGT